jgi:effector-binding domain-containing protein
MPRISNFEVLDKNEQLAISIRTRTSVENLPLVIGESYEKMFAYLKESGGFLAEFPYVAYYNMDMSDLDVEIGVPVSKSLPVKDNVKPSVIPGGKVVCCMYRGPYHETEQVYHDMVKWIQENGFKMSGSAYEYYYNSPCEFPENELLTMIAMPIV